MRFKLTLQLEPQESGREIPINYQYELSSVIYKIIASADFEFSEHLHTTGYMSTTKNFKLFTFSNLIAPNRGITLNKETNRLIINSDTVYWYLSFIPNESTQKFVQGVFSDQRFRLADRLGGARFRIREVQLMPDMKYNDDTEFETMSPISVSKHEEGRKFPLYIAPGDELYETALLTGLTERYKAINGKDFEGEKYCHLIPTSEPKSALICIKAGTKEESRIRGYRFRFKLQLPPELMDIAYAGGLGERCSMGFGMIMVKE